jgi:hypothetical protein
MQTKSARVPQTWADLADDIGPAAALVLSAAYGGVNVYIPGKMTRSHSIARLFEATGAGFGAALALSELYGDTTLHVPHLSVFFRIRQASRALELIRSGASHQQAAETLGISVRTLRRALHFAQALALHARLRRDSRRIRGDVLQAASSMTFGGMDVEHGQPAAGNAGRNDRIVASDKIGGEHGASANAEKPRHAVRQVRARRSVEPAAGNGA